MSSSVMCLTRGSGCYRSKGGGGGGGGGEEREREREMRG